MTDSYSGKQNHDADMQRVVDFFETLTLESAQCELPRIYTRDAYFKDPFSEVSGLDKITPIFKHMFKQVENPRFAVTSTVLQGNSAFMTWNFLFHMKRFSRDEQCIRGATHFRFDAEGLVNYHRDYWDAAEELYEKLPVLGSMMRGLKQIAKK